MGTGNMERGTGNGGRHDGLGALLALAVGLLAAAPCPAQEVPLLNPGFETGNLDGWERVIPETAFAAREQAARTGGFSLRCTGAPEYQHNSFCHLVQSLDLTPIEGARYRISGWVRGAIGPGDKSARLSVRMVGADDRTIGYADARLLPEPERWREVSETFRAAPGAVRLQVYVILSNLAADDVLYLDDISFTALDALGEPVTVTPPPFSKLDGSTPAPTADTIELATEGIAARVSRATGLLASLTLTQPTPIELHPAASDTTVIFLDIGDREVEFHTPVGEPVRDGATLTVTLAPNDDTVPLLAVVTYSTGENVFEETVVLRATGDIGALCRVGVRHGFVPGRWERIIGGLRPVRVIGAAEQTIFGYGEREGDLNLTRLDAWQSAVLPLTVLEGADRWVTIGDRSLDAFVTVAPNHPAGYLPSVQNNPTRIRAGDSFRFSLTWRAFDRRTHLLRDAWRWWGEHVRSDNPLLAGMVPFEGHFPPRTLPPGCEVTAGGKATGQGARIDTAKTLPGSNVWYFGWHDWINERYPTEGEWRTSLGGWTRQSAQDFRQALAEYRAEDLKCYLYFRQIANLAQRGTVIPAEWVRAEAGGSLEMYGGGYTVKLPEQVQRETGYPEIPWGMYDFSNDDFRADYLRQCRSCMDYYLPAGIAWDMGWDPKNPGIFAVQAEMYRWLARNHPEMRVISNEASGTPSQWYADCVLIENGILSGKSKWDYEVGKAFGTQIASIERGHHVRRLAELIVQGRPGWSHPPGRVDAERCASRALLQPDLPADEEARVRRLTFVMHMRAGLRNMGLGAHWAYADDMRYYPWPLPERLIQFMREIMGIPPLHQSFALRLDGGHDTRGLLHAGGWADATRLRLAVFNDDAAEASFELTVSREALARHGWTGPVPEADCFVVDTAAELTDVAPEMQETADGLRIEASLPPFALLTVAAGDAPAP